MSKNKPAKKKKPKKVIPKSEIDNPTELKEWLESEEKDYEKGVVIYLKYGKNANLKRMFLRKQCSFNEEKLEYELNKLSTVGIKGISKTTVKSFGRSHSKKASVSSNESNPELSEEAKEKMESLINQRTGIFNKKGILSNSLQSANTDEERKAIIEDINKLDEELTMVEAQINSLEKGESQDPVKKDELPEDGAELMKELNNARSRVSKNKKKAEQLGNTPEGKKIQEKVEKDENLIKEIEEKLK